MCRKSVLDHVDLSSLWYLCRAPLFVFPLTKSFQAAASLPHSWTLKGDASKALNPTRQSTNRETKNCTAQSSNAACGNYMQLRQQHAPMGRGLGGSYGSYGFLSKFCQEAACGCTSGSLLKTAPARAGVGFTGKSTARSLTVKTSDSVSTWSPESNI